MRNDWRNKCINGLKKNRWNSFAIRSRINIHRVRTEFQSHLIKNIDFSVIDYIGWYFCWM